MYLPLHPTYLSPSCRLKNPSLLKGNLAPRTFEFLNKPSRVYRSTDKSLSRSQKTAHASIRCFSLTGRRALDVTEAGFVIVVVASALWQQARSRIRRASWKLASIRFWSFLTPLCVSFDLNVYYYKIFQTSAGPAASCVQISCPDLQTHQAKCKHFPPLLPRCHFASLIMWLRYLLSRFLLKQAVSTYTQRSVLAMQNTVLAKWTRKGIAVRSWKPYMKEYIIWNSHKKQQQQKERGNRMWS